MRARKVVQRVLAETGDHVGDAVTVHVEKQRLGQDQIRCAGSGSVGGVLPELPLSLDAGRVVFVNLEASYEDARVRSRL